jgi:hypothetical protein
MKRLNPFGSLAGYGLTLLLFVGLGISLWLNRGMAFSPGPVTAKSQAGVILAGFASHADFEKLCGSCHDPLRSNLATKCLECHTDINMEIEGKEGVHGQISQAEACAACHAEHQGRDFNPTSASFQAFDHSSTNFSLIWHQENYDATPMECSECHKNDDLSVVDDQVCLDCHTGHDSAFGQQHVTEFGSDCLGCHDGADRMQDYNHGQSGFALEGRHAELACTNCHNPDHIREVAPDCAGCHNEPSIHLGLFEQPCDTCHSAQAWTPAKLNGSYFGHLTTASFSLNLHQVDYYQQSITCKTCHPEDWQSTDLQICVDCHNQQEPVFMTEHLDQYGSTCTTCHDGVDRLSDFQHANFFALDGAHASTACADCHTNQVFRGTPTECVQCHEEPEIHAGTFGLKCDYCHSTQVWSPANLRKHIFPLNHGVSNAGQPSQCDTCHTSNYVEYTCTNCHDHQQDELIRTHQEAGITDQELPACIDCHADGTSPQVGQDY